jgi:hypothetical protein
METIAKYIEFEPYGIGLILLGIIIRYFIERRKFNRRGMGGLQHFSGFGIALVITILEWLGKWIANIMIIAGIIMLIKW